MPITMDGDEIEAITMDGDEITEVTMDGDVVWELASELYLYDEGTHEEDWVEGYSNGQGSQSKEPDYLYLVGLYDMFDGSGQRTYVTDKVVDLTGRDTLKVDWESLDAGMVYLIASTDKDGNQATYDARLGKGGFNRTVDSLDISNLSGDYYIRTHAVGMGMGDDAELKVYKVWLE